MVLDFDDSLDLGEGLKVKDDNVVGVPLITDGSGNSQFEETTLIYNENFGRAIDTSLEWTETLTGSGSKSQTNGVLTLICTASAGVAEELNNGFQVDISGKTKKVRLLVNMSYAVQSSDSYIGFESSSNFRVYFQKQTGSNDNWRGYIMDEDTTEYETGDISVSRSTNHDFEIIFNSNRTDFYIDGVLKGSLTGDKPVANCKLVLHCGDDETALAINHVRVWETIIPK